MATTQTVGHQLAQQTATELQQKEFIAHAEAVENHKGPFVRAFVSDEVAREELYDIVEQFPCFIDVVLER